MLQLIWIVLAVICAAYGVLIASLRSGTGFFAFWFVLAAVFFCLFLAARHRLWQHLPGPAKGAFLLVVCAGLCLFVLVEARILSGFGQKGEAGLDYLIVLGAQVRTDGPSVVLRYRLDTAAAYLRNEPDTVCIVSGGQGPNEPWPEAEGMRDYLLEQGTAAERILMEPDSQSTRENIRNSMTMLDPETDRVGIVTNDFHLFRGRALAEQAGIRHVCGIAAPSRALYLPNNLAREFFGVLKDMLTGNIRL